MRGERKEYKLKDVATILTGFPFKGNKYSDKGIRVLRGENVTIGNLRWDTIKCWNEPFQQTEKYSLKSGDIVIGMDGSRVGKNRAQIRNEELPLLLAQRVACVRNNGLSNQDYLAHIIKSKPFEDYVSAVQTGTSIPHISQKQIEDFGLNLPPLPTQRRIASILSSLDEKIELNRQTNKTLETITQALFKEWFVDFNFPGSTGEMMDSELGEIPKGWKVSNISDLIDVRDGTHDSPKSTNTGKRLVTSKHLREDGTIDFESANYISEKDFNAINKRSKVDYLDIVYSMIGTIGNILIVGQQVVDFAIKNIGLFKTSQSPELAMFLNSHLRTEFSKRYFLERHSGSTQQYVTLKTLRDLPVIVPSIEVLISYNRIAFPIFQILQNKNDEIQILTQLRDTLLPNLMRGEIKF